MENVLAIATIIAGLAGIFTIIFPFVKIYFDRKRYKEYLNQKSESFHNRIVKRANKIYKNEGQYKRSSNYMIEVINEFIKFLDDELEEKENIGKRKRIRKKIKKQKGLLYQLTNRYNKVQEGNAKVEYLAIKNEITNFFLKF